MIIKHRNFLLTGLKLPENALPFHMIWLNPGNIIMGNLQGSLLDLYDLHDSFLEFEKWKVKITKGFWLAQFPVTQSHWESLNMDEIIKNFKPNETMFEVQRHVDDHLAPYKSNPNFPLYGKNWIDAVLFCRELNIKYKNLIPEKYHFNLPMEAQWEYACLAEKESVNISYPNLKGRYGVESIKSANETSKNNWSLHGMLNNTREMCFDIAHTYYNYEELDEFTSNKDDWHIDWNPNLHLLINDDSVPIDYMESVRKRVVKGLYHPAYREYTYVEKAEYSFRITLRPVTKADLNDPILKLNNINILGDQE